MDYLKKKMKELLDDDPPKEEKKEKKEDKEDKEGKEDKVKEDKPDKPDDGTPPLSHAQPPYLPS